MDIKSKVREALLEGKHKKTSHKNEYGCVMIFLDVDKDKWGELLDLIDDEDLYDPKDDPSFGKEKDPHVTVLFGLHGDVPDEDVEKKIDKFKKPDIKFGGISAFKNKVFEVIKFDVESKELHASNAELIKLPNTQTYPDYHPHCTIAYVKPDKADKYVKKLKDHTAMPMKVTNVVYSKVDGTKKTYKLT